MKITISNLDSHLGFTGFQGPEPASALVTTEHPILPVTFYDGFLSTTAVNATRGWHG